MTEGPVSGRPTRPAKRGRGAADGALRAGDVLAGRYEVRGQLGRGGMGAVFEARDRELGIDVALKVLLGDAGHDDDALRALKREVLVARQVSHRNVCRLHDLGRDGATGVLFCTMELLRGEPLSQRLRARGPLPIAEALAIARDVARGLDAIHEAGVVHRDFKSGNVMLAAGPEGERAVVTDFGLALDRLEGDGDEWVAGTPAFMAPEQLRGERPTAAVDVYAFGVVLFQMATGRVPFEGSGTLAVAQRKLEGDAPEAGSLRASLPSAWNDVIRNCLARDPGRRFRGAGDAWAALAGEAADAAIAPRRRGRLPAETDAFVGRGEERARIAASLRAGGLLTLVGTAGTGKTRLAVRCAHEARDTWPGGAWFCDLTEARGASGIAAAVAAAFDVPVGRGDPIVEVGRAIARRGRALVVLDNFEHVVAHASSTVARWRAEAEDATFLVTSRERLGLPGEDVVDVPPLQASEGVDLFMDRARASRPGFAAGGDDLRAVERIVARLDALPLAVELAAARARVMTPVQIAERLDAPLRLLVQPQATGRHRTLRAAIDESWDLLAPWERSAFAQCAVFEGGFTLEAAESVVDLVAWPEAPWMVDVVQALVDKSLLRVTTHEGAPRFAMLASLQEYAREKLGDADAVERRHGRHFAGFGTADALARLSGEGGPARRRALMRDLDNLRAACRRACARGDGATAAEAFDAAGNVLEMRGPLSEIAALGDEVLGIATLAEDAKGRALRRTAVAHHVMGRLDEARRGYEASLDIARKLGDRTSEGLVLGTLGVLLRELGDMSDALAHLERALAIHRDTGNRRLEGVVLGNLGILCRDVGRLADARGHYERAIAVQASLGDRRAEGLVRGNLGNLLRACGNGEEAHRQLQRALEIARELGDRQGEGVVLGNLGALLIERGDAGGARDLLEAALEIHRDVGNVRFEAIVLGTLADVLRGEGRLGEARERAEAALALARRSGDRRAEASRLATLAELQAQEGRSEEAAALFDAAERALRDADDRLDLAEILCAHGMFDERRGDAASARARLSEASRIADELGLGDESAVRVAVNRLRLALDGAPP